MSTLCQLVKQQTRKWLTVSLSSPILLVIPLGLLLFVSFGEAQTHGYGFGGVTVGKQFSDGHAGRFGVGGNWRVAPYLTAGGEVGSTHKNGAGALLSGTVGIHPLKRVEKGIDPFFVVGVAGVYVSGETGVYAMVGGGFNYWFHPHVAARTEFRGYPGGQDMNSFGEFRFGISFR